MAGAREQEENIVRRLLTTIDQDAAVSQRKLSEEIGIAVGSVIGLEAMFAGPVCGASMNPARSLAPAVVSGHTEHLWVYLAAPVAGALLAVPLSALVHRKAAAA